MCPKLRLPDLGPGSLPLAVAAGRPSHAGNLNEEVQFKLLSGATGRPDREMTGAFFDTRGNVKVSFRSKRLLVRWKKTFLLVVSE